MIWNVGKEWPSNYHTFINSVNRSKMKSESINQVKLGLQQTCSSVLFWGEDRLIQSHYSSHSLVMMWELLFQSSTMYQTHGYQDEKLAIVGGCEAWNRVS